MVFKNYYHENKFIFLSVFIVGIILNFIFYGMGIYPFGENIVLRIDMYHQYAPFYEELRNTILSGKSLYYSWDGALGKEFLSQYAYYTGGLLSFIVLFFSQQGIGEAMIVLITIKFMFTGGFFAYYLKKAYHKDGLIIVIFSIFYSLSAFMAAYYWNVMWLDAVALFPIVALGIERIVSQGNYKTYCISLAIVIITNFYIAFLVCIFSVLYFLVKLFSAYGRKETKIICNRMAIFAFASLIAGGISMFLSIPVFITLQRTAVSDSGFPAALSLYFNPFDFVASHFAGVKPQILVRNESLPNVYCGLVTILLAPFYFTLKEIRKKEKILTLALLVFMFMCFWINQFDYLIHGMHFPANLPHRFAFVYIFVLVNMAFRVFMNIDDIGIKPLIMVFAIYLLYAAVNTYVIPKNANEIVLTAESLVLNAELLLVYLTGFVLYKTKVLTASVWNIIMLCVVMVEFAVTAGQNIRYTGTMSRSTYIKNMDDTSVLNEYLRSVDEGFYRTEFRRLLTINDGALNHMKTFSQFSSTANGSTSYLIKNLGLSATSNSYRYYDPTQLIDAIFSIKYIIQKESPLEGNDLTLIKQQNSLFLYENPYVLPVGFMVDKAVLDWDSAQSNPFVVQNDFIEYAAGVSQDMFQPLALTALSASYAEVTSDNGPGEFVYELTEPENLALIPAISATIYNEKSQYVFLYVDSPNSRQVTIKIGNTESVRDFATGRSLFDVGFVEAGQEIHISFRLDDKGEDEIAYRRTAGIKVFGASYTKKVFEEAFDKLNDAVLEVRQYGDNLIEGSITVDKPGILFTSIPYSTGWKIMVDGNIVQSLNIENYSLLGIDLDTGAHFIQFEYEPPGFKAGIVLSILSIAIWSGYEFCLRKKRCSAVK